MDVHAVGDDFQVDALIGQCRGHRPGLAVVDRGHGVEQVGSLTGTPVEGLGRRLVIGVGVPDGHDHVLGPRFGDDLLGPVQLRCDGEDPHGALSPLDEVVELGDAG